MCSTISTSEIEMKIQDRNNNQTQTKNDEIKNEPAVIAISDKIVNSTPATIRDVDKDKNYEPRFTQEWVQVLINLRMKHAKSFTRKRHSATNAWMSIYNEMIELGAPEHITVEKIKKKWMNLIARYKHFKFIDSPAGTITWPYFDQIDRAYERNPNIIELRRNFNNNCKNVESDSENESMASYADSMMKRTQFTTTLIELRCTYKHLFTGKKFAAQRGWMVIKNMHPDGDKYTVDQFSKCWQNLTQRYRNLIDSEKDLTAISWMHFPTMHKAMERLGVQNEDTLETNNISTQPLQLLDLDMDLNSTPNVINPTSTNQSTSTSFNINSPSLTSTSISPILTPTSLTSSTSATTSPTQVVLTLQSSNIDEALENTSNDNELFDEEEENDSIGRLLFENFATQASLDPNEPKRKRRRLIKPYCEATLEESPIDDLLKYLIQRDIRLDEHHEELMKVLDTISNKLNK